LVISQEKELLKNFPDKIQHINYYGATVVTSVFGSGLLNVPWKYPIEEKVLPSNLFRLILGTCSRKHCFMIGSSQWEQILDYILKYHGFSCKCKSYRC